MTISSRTQSRERKLALLEDARDSIWELVLMSHKQRERIHVAKYREIVRLLNDMIETAKKGKNDYGLF